MRNVRRLMIEVMAAIMLISPLSSPLLAVTVPGVTGDINPPVYEEQQKKVNENIRLAAETAAQTEEETDATQSIIDECTNEDGTINYELLAQKLLEANDPALTAKVLWALSSKEGGAESVSKLVGELCKTDEGAMLTHKAKGELWKMIDGFGNDDAKTFQARDIVDAINNAMSVVAERWVAAVKAGTMTEEELAAKMEQFCDSYLSAYVLVQLKKDVGEESVTKVINQLASTDRGLRTLHGAKWGLVMITDVNDAAAVTVRNELRSQINAEYDEIAAALAADYASGKITAADLAKKLSKINDGYLGAQVLLETSGDKRDALLTELGKQDPRLLHYAKGNLQKLMKESDDSAFKESCKTLINEINDTLKDEVANQLIEKYTNEDGSIDYAGLAKELAKIKDGQLAAEVLIRISTDPDTGEVDTTKANELISAIGGEARYQGILLYKMKNALQNEIRNSSDETERAGLVTLVDKVNDYINSNDTGAAQWLIRHCTRGGALDVATLAKFLKNFDDGKLGTDTAMQLITKGPSGKEEASALVTELAKTQQGKELLQSMQSDINERLETAAGTEKTNLQELLKLVEDALK